jgi:putative transposase
VRFVAEHRDRFGVEPILRVLEVKPSTYYDWVKAQRCPPERDLVDLGLLSNIYEVWQDSGCTYGADRVHQALRRQQIATSRKRVARLMAGQGWRGAVLRKGWKTASTVRDPQAKPAPDLVERDFTASAPDRLWVADCTRIPTGEGVLWLAAVRDAFSRRIVGWKTSISCDTDLVLGALEYAVCSREARAGQLIHHGDHGSNYTSIRFGEQAALHGVRLSMGSVGDSYDNALMENFWSTLKTELVYRRRWATHSQAENELFDYIDGFYNPRRIQRRLGYRSPEEYERAWRDGLVEVGDPDLSQASADAPERRRRRRASSGTALALPATPARRVRRGSRVKGGPKARRAAIEDP